MVSPIRRRSKDPNGLDRGPGLYYLRGGKHKGSFTLPRSGVTVKGAYYSKYTKEADFAKKSNGWEQNRIGAPSKVANVYGHATDGDLGKKLRNRITQKDNFVPAKKASTKKNYATKKKPKERK